MKIKEVCLHKEFKKGLPNYSNITVGIHMTFEVGEDEKVDWDSSWDIINRELNLQSSDVDQAWMRMDVQKDNYKFTIKTKK